MLTYQVAYIKALLFLCVCEYYDFKWLRLSHIFNAITHLSSHDYTHKISFCSVCISKHLQNSGVNLWSLRFCFTVFNVIALLTVSNWSWMLSYRTHGGGSYNTSQLLNFKCVYYINISLLGSLPKLYFTDPNCSQDLPI